MRGVAQFHPSARRIDLRADREHRHSLRKCRDGIHLPVPRPPVVVHPLVPLVPVLVNGPETLRHRAVRMRTAGVQGDGTARTKGGIVDSGDRSLDLKGDRRVIITSARVVKPQRGGDGGVLGDVGGGVESEGGIIPVGIVVQGVRPCHRHAVHRVAPSGRLLVEDDLPVVKVSESIVLVMMPVDDFKTPIARHGTSY